MEQHTRLTALERIVRHERAVLLVVLGAITLLCWSWIIPMGQDMYGRMTGLSAWMMTTVWDPRHLLLLCAMWVVMMVGMMLPSAVPTLLLYAAIARRRATGTRSVLRVYAMAGGYVLVWAAFSVAATVLQRSLSRWLVLSPMMRAVGPAATGAILLIGGAYQFMPIKRSCLAWCSAPIAFLTRRWRHGAGGAFRMGVEHGLYCLGCCWALMLLLFAGGVMNLFAIASLTALVLVEKLTPAGAAIGRAAGVALVGAGLWMIAR